MKKPIRFLKYYSPHFAVLWTVLFWSMAFQVQAQPCAMVCNDQLNVGVDPVDCSAEVTIDAIFPTHPADCSAGNFTVTLEDENGNPVNNPFDGTNYIGQTLTYLAVDATSGNRCDGIVVVDDNFIPDLTCMDVIVDCTANDLTPGSVQGAIQTETHFVLMGEPLVDADRTRADFTLALPAGAEIIDVDVFLDIAHPRVGDLEVTLIAPSATVRLFTNPGTPNCDGDDLLVLFDSEAVNDYTLFDATCGNLPAISGNYQPQNTLSPLYGPAANGTWSLVINDLIAGNVGFVNQAFINITYSTDNAPIPFPVPGTATVSPSSGTGPFTVSNFDNCSDVTLTYTDRTISEPMCSSTTVATIFREWTATDAAGNSKQCTQEITLEQINIGDIPELPDYDDMDLPALPCYLKETDPGNQIIPYVGWNAIDPGDIFGDQYVGHPSPYDVLYPDGTVKWYGTGEPQVGNCNTLSFTFNDVRINHCAAPSSSDGCFKIIRTWTILEWCTSEIRTMTQIIKVKDDEGPTISGLPDVTISTATDICEATWPATVPALSDDCSDTDGYIVTASAGIVQFNTTLQQYVISGLPLGDHEVYYAAKDCCGNTSLDTLDLTVEDQVPPVPVCHNVGISLSQDGFADLTASSLDGDDNGGNASHDNCSDPIYFKAIRMDNLLGSRDGVTDDQANSNTCDSDNGDDDGVGLGNQVWFDDDVEFCCADAGKTIQVVLRVFDIDPGAGAIDPDDMTNGFLKNHYNDCMVNVVVMNNLQPVFSCPADVRIECTVDLSTYFDGISATPPGDSAFYVQPNGASSDTSFIGFFAVDSNCDDTKVYIHDEGTLNQCNLSVVSDTDNTPAPITRFYVVVERSGQTFQCTQSISLIDSNPFDETNITFPADFEVFISAGNCNPSLELADLTMAQQPQFTNRDCAKLLLGKTDEIFEREDFIPTPAPGVCRKIIRTWSIREWCQSAGPWEDEHAIVIKDTDGPVLTCPTIEPVEADDNGMATVDVTITVTDNCTFTFDNTNVGYLITLESGMTIAGTGLTASNTYPVGTHSVSFIATDSCGLTGQCTTSVVVTDDPCDDIMARDPIIALDANGDATAFPVQFFKQGKTPPMNTTIERTPGGTAAASLQLDCSDITDVNVNPTTINVIINIPTGGTTAACPASLLLLDDTPPSATCRQDVVVYLDANGEADISADTLVTGGSDNCEVLGPIEYFFDDTNLNTRTILCSEISNNTLALTITYRDAVGLEESCRAVLSFRDTFKVCDNVDDNQRIVLGGAIKNEDGEKVKGVRINLSGGMSDEMMTSDDGQFVFEEVPPGYDYVITPEKDSEPMNGVSTYDLVLMSRHILQVDELDSPYKLIAADINRSGNLSTFDILQLRKLILFIDTTFEYNTSWRFIDKDFVFPASVDPFTISFPEIYYVENLAEDQVVDFVAVKTGDVNGSVAANGLQASDQRHAEGLFDLFLEDRDLVAGKTYTIPVRTKQFNEVSGYQFSLHLDQAALEVLEISGSERINMSAGNFGQHLLDKGVLTCSWNKVRENNLEDEQLLFELKVRAKQNSRLSELLRLSSDYTRAEAYTATGELLAPQLQFTKEPIQITDFILYQNQPNPFRETTVIAFHLPENTQATLRLYDASGREVKSFSQQYRKGYHEISIHRSDLPNSGVLYYQLQTPKHTAVQKMTLLE